MTDQTNAQKAEIPSGWHVDKRLNLGHLVSTVALAVAVLSWGNGIEKRVQKNTLSNQFFAQQEQEKKQQYAANRKELKDELRLISSKIDRLIEKQMK